MMKGVLAAALGLVLAGASFAGGTDPPVFDGQVAWELVRTQCGFGPRNPGSAGHRKCLGWMEADLRASGAVVRRQPFSYTLPGAKTPLSMCNLLASFRPENPRRILLAAHWDTRPWADLDPDSTRRSEPILGANDGASGVAVLLQLARHFKTNPPPVGVDLVFFDGEDLGTSANPDGYFRGSREYGRRALGQKPPEHAVLLDMVGDSDLLFYVEGNSFQAVPDQVRWFWEGAREVAPDFFADQIGYYVEDDHLPLIAAGIPCMVLIDFHYKHWHTLADTPDKVSPASLQVVGDVLVRLLYRP
ncbi:MAG: M28 family peptidase [Candidatus Eisenbacteria bacterium]|nr:M28 family peptidase [Candidatus Eisenbacteria bacterium]